MRLTHIHITGYRSLSDVSITLDADTAILCIVGPNGLGKTNLLEALYTMSISKPFRGKRMEELVQHGTEHTSISLEWQDGTTERSSQLFCQAKPFAKQFHLNGSAVTPSAIVGSLNMVLFHPEDLSGFVDSPAYRRRYLNVLISQVDPHYTQDLITYTKVLKQRNALLRSIKQGAGERSELAYWDGELARVGVAIATRRLDTIAFLNTVLSEHYSTLAGSPHQVQCRYKTLAPLTEEYHGEHFLQELRQRQEQDILYCATSVGPHRDDLLCTINDKDVLRYASRGELRSLLLSLKLGEVSYIQHHTGNTPILLLDDVFSELDLQRQKALLHLIAPLQSILTVTHTEPLDTSQSNITVIKLASFLGKEERTVSAP